MTELPFPEIADPVAELVSFAGPVDLVRRGLPLPTTPGVYVVACRDCVAHIGTSGNLRTRVRTLAALGTHRGSSEVLCAAHCTRSSPKVWWYPVALSEAKVVEHTLKQRYGEPPWPREAYAACVNGAQLRDDLVTAAGSESWEAGFVEAVFAIGEKLGLLFQPRFDSIWQSLGIPPGPWERL